MDVGSQRDITSGPTIGDGDKASGNPPGPGDILLGDGAEVWENPNNVEGKGVETEPGNL